MNVPTNNVITIQTNKASYSPGDLVAGKIYLNISLEQPATQLYLEFSGIEAYSAFYLTNSTGYNDIVKVKWPLSNWDNELPVGHIEVPFSFMLPLNIPVSFHQETKDFAAHITYRLEAKLESKGKLIVRQHKKLVIRRPVARKPKSFSEEQTFPLAGCGSDGFLTIRAHFEKDIYSERDQAIAIVEVDTSQTQLYVNQIQFNLRQQTTLSGHTFTHRRLGSSFPGVPARKGPEPQVLGFILPSFTEDDHDLDRGLGPTTQGEIIRSEFFLEILFETWREGNWANCCAPTEAVLHHIDISYTEPQDDKVILPDDWSPHVLPEFRLGCSGFSEKKLQPRENDDKQRMIETQMIPNKPLNLKNETNRLDLIGRQV